MPVQRRYRSAVACQRCRQRKVRCSVTVTGVPCSNCTQDRTSCTIQETSYESSQRAISVSTRNNIATETPEVLPASRYGVDLRTSFSELSPDCAPQDQSSHPPAHVAFDTTNILQDHVDVHLNPELQRDLDEEKSGAELSHAARGQRSSNSCTPFYTGEQPGVTSLIDVQQPLSRHIMLKSNPPRALSQADHEFLYHKGALSPLLMHSHKELLRAYFHHVHPMLPILHLARLQELELPNADSPHSMLLYWSMAVVAVNFVPSSVWKAEGFTSKKQMKDTMYDRAKCMYDNSGETDKEVLLQAALLLSFWHSERDSHSQPWYWSGVAINWCQIIGLHRDPDANRFNPLVSPQRRSLWRRLWASCLFRDRWLSLTLGRPLRIRLSDCDMPFPDLNDVVNDLDLLSTGLRERYLPKDLNAMIEHWILLIRLSRMLGEILSLFYQQLGTKATLLQFENMESELSRFAIPELNNTHKNKLAIFSYYNLQLHYQATLITFYRPFVSTVPHGLPSDAQESWKAKIRGHLETAATNSNGILDFVAREGLVSFATPMTPPLLVPAMHVHLLSCKSENFLTRRLAFNKLEMCMTIMRELQKTHTSASIFCGVFGEAVRQLVPGPLDETIWGAAQTRNPSTVVTTVPMSAEPVNLASYASQSIVTDDLLESLLNETSTYNFWESMSMFDQSFAD